MNSLKSIRNSGLHRCFNLTDREAKSRIAIAGSNVILSLVNSISTGIFYTGFLLGYGIDLVNIGLITMAPYLASMIGLLAPAFLRKFQKRRYLLAAMRFLYYFTNLVGITIVPEIIQDPSARVAALTALVLISNILNAFSTCGYTEWHLFYLPDDVRYDYLMSLHFVKALVSGVMLLTSGAIADSLKGTPYQMTVLVGMRYVSMILGILDVILLLIPKEYKYVEKEEGTSLGTSLRAMLQPIKNKKFMMTEVILVMWATTSAAYGTFWNAYLLDSIGVSYVFTQIIDALYAVFFLLLYAVWKKVVNQRSWIPVYSVTLGVFAIFQIVMVFLTPANYIWLMFGSRMIQHVVGVAQNTAHENLLYLNMPLEDRSSYISTNMFLTNLGSLVGRLLSTFFVGVVGTSFGLTVFGFTITAIPFITLATGVLQLGISTYAMAFRRVLDPSLAKKEKLNA